MKKLKKAQMMEEGRVNEEERARKREKNIKKRRKARERKKEVRREERKRRERMEEFRQKLREWRGRHFAGMEHQTRIASPAKRPKIWGDFNSIWATEEFKTVHGPNLNPEWIT